MSNYIHQFPEQIQKRIDAGAHCGSCVGKGWLPLIVDLDGKLSELDPDYAIDQIKEKFGGLRYYVNAASEAGWKLIDEAEKRSLTICEICGNEGEPSSQGWIRTRCDEHKEIK